MKVVFKLMILFLLVSCNKKTEENFPEYETQEELNERITEGKPFFDFDEVVHYQIEISEEELSKIETAEEKNEKEQMFFTLMFTGVPKNQKSESVFWKNLDSIVEFKRIVKSEFLSDLKNKIFTEKKCEDSKGEVSNFSACAPIYRDILIFRKLNNNVGIAKVCFECGIANFSKANAITDCFGHNLTNELQRLENILKENKKLK